MHRDRECSSAKDAETETQSYIDVELLELIQPVIGEEITKLRPARLVAQNASPLE